MYPLEILLLDFKCLAKKLHQKVRKAVFGPENEGTVEKKKGCCYYYSSRGNGTEEKHRNVYR